MTSFFGVRLRLTIGSLDIDDMSTFTCARAAMAISYGDMTVDMPSLAPAVHECARGHQCIVAVAISRHHADGTSRHAAGLPGLGGNSLLS